MYYLGQVPLAAPVYIYLTDSNVTGGNKKTTDMTKRILKLFSDGSSQNIRKKTTLWKNGSSDRLDIQNDNIAGKNIDLIFKDGTYSNFSYQAGDDSFSVVFIENSITSSIAVQDALKAYYNDKQYDDDLLQLLLAMSLVSNLTGKKVVINNNFIPNQNDITTHLTGIFYNAMVAGKRVF